MVSIKNKNVIITGASSGIGRSTAIAFAKEGANLILCARRKDRLSEVQSTILDEYKVKCSIYVLDVANKDQVNKVCSEIIDDSNGIIDILVNNAGLAKELKPIHTGDLADWDIMIDTNLKGLLYMTRNILPIMVKNDSGHIISIGSTAGRQTYVGGNVYCATKHAVRALNSAIKQDLLGTKIRVTSIDPGIVETEFSNVRFNYDNEKANKVYQGWKPLDPENVADAILYATTRPLHVNVSEVLLTPLDQAPSMMINKK
jgi:3-hydroxy acid dehydrogenase / malonic semialdehyde reductase